LISSPSLAGEAPSAEQVILRSLEQEGQVDYEGLQITLIDRGAREQRTEQVVKFKRPNRLRIEYLEPPRMRGDVVVDDGARTRRFVRALGVVAEVPRESRGLSREQRPQLLRAVRRGALRLALEGEESVAGRRAWVVTLAPTPPQRPRRKLWIDQEHGLPLRVQQIGPGERRTDTYFQRIRFDPVLSDSDFVLDVPEGTPVLPRKPGRSITLAEAESIAREGWGQFYQVRRLPPGMTLGATIRLELDGKPVIQLRYGDGKRGFSLFQSAGPAPSERLESWSAPDAAGTPGRSVVYQFSRGRARLTLVGPYSGVRLRALAEGVE
jgi:outer membrane lipoprotein-sorting protein